MTGAGALRAYADGMESANVVLFSEEEARIRA